MPRAGWCRECGEWVWVDPEGACPAGHGPECISHEYDARPTDGDSDSAPLPPTPAPPAPAPEPDSRITDGVGEGPIPASMQRFNWGAFMIPVVWGVVYGVWPVVFASIATSTIIPLVLAFLASAFIPGATSDNIPVQVLLGIVVVSDAASSFVRLWVGASGNRLFWRREFRRLDADPAAVARISTGRFLSRQRLWTVWGAVGVVLLLGVSAPGAYELWKPNGLGWAAVAEPVVFLLAQLALAVWLSRAMRHEHPIPVTPAEDSAEDLNGPL